MKPADPAADAVRVRVEFREVAAGCFATADPGAEVSATEAVVSGDTAEHARRLARLLAVRRACGGIFRELVAAGELAPADFNVQEVQSGNPVVQLSPRAREILSRRLVADIEIVVEWDQAGVTVAARVRRHPLEVPWMGRWVYHLFPFRRRLALENLGRVFGDFVPPGQLQRLAQAYYAHLARSLREMVTLPLKSGSARREWVRVENVESPLGAHRPDRGLLLLTGHFGNWEAATVAALQGFPQYRGKLHFLRRALKPKWFDHYITRRFRRAGFGTLPKRGSMEKILSLLGEGAIIVFTFDQHAGRPDGIPVEFFGHPAGTFKSLAILALSTGAPVVPASTWREPDGRHVLRFEDPLPLIEHENTGEAIRRNTRAYNAALERMLLRHPEQWIWMHRRWKLAK